MSLENLPEWLLPLWQDLRGRRARMPHALLFCGPEGSGKRLFAEHLAHALLCQSPDAEGFACGVCPDCTWLASGNHPDYFTLMPAADEAAGSEEAEGGAEPGKKEKAKSTQIVIDQVRTLQSSLEIGATGHSGGVRVVILDPAEAMNLAAANALLKALEEPTGSIVYLVLSHVPQRLLPTIRSRCQVLDFPRPTEAQAAAWMQQQGVDNLALLGFASGLPIAARTYARGLLAETRSQLANDLGALASRDPLRLAAEWEARLKAKGAQEAGLNMAVFVDWLSRWLSDGVRLAGGQGPRFFADFKERIDMQAQGRLDAWLSAYREVQAVKAIALHPLNSRLFLEDILLNIFKRIASR